MPELVTIPISYFEVAITYERAVFELLTNRSAVLQRIFDALEAWHPGVDDTEVVGNGKTSQQGVTVKLPLKGASFFVGPVSCRFSRDNAVWESGNETIAILDKALSALTHSSGVVLGMKNVGISMHIQPRKLHFMEILKPFVPRQLAAIDSNPVKTMATVAKWENHKVTIDGSGALANGLYLKLERNFDAGVTYDEITDRLHSDEDELFKILDIEEEQG